MRRILVLTAIFFGCEEAERPDDYSVQLWGSCMWDTQEVSQLCAPPLECAGMCKQPCADDTSCPSVDGHLGGCFYGQCSFACDYQTAKEQGADPCPETGGAPLMCGLDNYCISER